MSNENKKAREKLEKLYGKECFIKKLKLRERYGEGHTYKGKNQVSKAVWYRNQQLTYHHIQEKSKGGKATVENGAILSAENHEWFHKQSKDRQREMNAMFQAYKKGVNLRAVEMTLEGVKQHHQMTFDELGVGYVEISLEDNTEEDKKFLELSEEEQKEYNRYLEQKRKDAYKKFGAVPPTPPEPVRKKAEIDEEWQKEIIKDLEMEFNERNRGGYGR